LQTINMPDSVNTIGTYCFAGCTSLVNVTLPQYITTLPEQCFNACRNLSEVTIPQSVESIGSGCFSSCSGLTEISIPNRVIYIGKYCFSACESLTEVSLPGTLASLPERCFYNSRSLAAITIPNTVQSIGTGCFEGCTNLKESYFLGNAPTVRTNAFLNCSPSFSVYYLNSATGYSNPWLGYTTKPFTPSITFDSQGGSAVPVQLITYGSIGTRPEPPVKYGYQFQGWYLDSAYATPWDFASDRVLKEVMLYAKWIPNNYVVNFNANGGSGTMPGVGTKYDVPCYLSKTDFTKTGYSFAGWSTAPDGSVEFPDESSVMNLTGERNGTVTLYAIWRPNTYAIKFNDNGVTTGTMARLPMVYDVSKALTANTFKKNGYVFLGWATSSTGSVVYKDKASVKNLTATNGATINLYAKWGPPIVAAASYNYNSVKISWAAAGGATSYRIYRATSAAGSYTLVNVASATARSYVNTGLVTGKTYYYKVSVVAGGKTYHHSAYKSAKAIPSTPTVTLSKASTTSIKVAWTGVSGATRYQIFRATSATGTYSYQYTASSTARSWVNTGLTAGKTYYYKVRAYHLEGTTKVYGKTSAVKYLKI
jgi:uncharacterized repeat protein (TIGR02543 family)